jgi:GNAT superfamily N-acetyltransferase
MKPIIREASPTDAEAIVAVLIASKEASFPDLVDEHDRNGPFWTNRWRSYLAEGSRAQMSRGDGFALVAEVGSRAVGFAAFHHTARHGTDAELESIYLLKEAQGSGLGSELLRRIAVRLRADGSRSMCVGYNPRNPYKRFYLKHGAIEINPHWAVWRDLGALCASGPA